MVGQCPTYNSLFVTDATISFQSAGLPYVFKIIAQVQMLLENSFIFLFCGYFRVCQFSNLFLDIFLSFSFVQILPDLFVND